MRWTALQPRGSPLKGWARPVTRQLLVGGVVALQPASAARAAARRPTVGFLRCSAPPGGFIEAFELGLAPRPGPYQSGLVTSLSQGGGNISRNSEIPADHAETPRTAPGTHAPALPPVIMRSPRGLAPALRSARRAQALIQPQDVLFTAHRARLAGLALRNRRPAIYGFQELVDAD